MSSCPASSLNTLYLFGLVLAIGIVVYDAILSGEVERHIETAVAARATQAMGRCGPDHRHRAGTGRLLSRPPSSAPDRRFYRQFALTIAISRDLGVTRCRSPALASRLLRPRGAAPDAVQRVADRVFGRFFGWFNRLFSRGSAGYVFGVTRLLRVSAAVVLLYGGLLALTAAGFSKVPQGFIPAQDKDYLVAFAQLPDAATLDRTDAGSAMTDLALSTRRPGRDLLQRLSVNGS